MGTKTTVQLVLTTRLFLWTQYKWGGKINEGLHAQDSDDHFSSAENTRVFRILLWIRKARAQLFQTEPDVFSLHMGNIASLKHTPVIKGTCLCLYEIQTD